MKKTWLLLSIAVLAAACSKKQPDPLNPTPTECTAGAKDTCTCTGGLSGERTCNAAGNWDACACGCVPECGARVCGLDPVCGTSCGACGMNQVCSDSGACTADCNIGCTGRECGTEPLCGTSCGSCLAGAMCSTEGQCVATLLTIEGRTIANADITVLVGSTPIETTSDIAGTYAVQVGTPGQDSNLVVSLTARGRGDSSGVGFAGVIGTISALEAVAGEDEIVEEREHHGVVANAISSARYAAMYAVNGSRTPANASELDAAEELLNDPLSGDEMFIVACAVKMVSTGSLALPTGVTNAIDLLQDIYALRAFIAPYTNVDVYAPGFLDGGRTAVLTDTTELGRFEPSDLATHFVELVKTRDGDIGSGGTRWELGGDGTGVYQNTTGDSVAPPQTLTWSIDQGALKVDFDQPIVQEITLGVEQIAARVTDEQTKQFVRLFIPADSLIPIPVDVLGRDIVLLSRGSKIDWVVEQDRVRWHFDTGLAPYGIPAQIEELEERNSEPTWRRASSIQYGTFAESEVVGTWALRMGTELDYPGLDGYLPRGALLFGTAMVTFNAGGTATALFGRSQHASALTWEIGASGTLEVHGPGNIEHTYSKWVERGALKGLMLSYQPLPDQKYMSYDRDAKVDPAFQITGAVLATRAEEYWQTTVNAEFSHKQQNGAILLAELFGYRFDPNDAAQRVFVDQETLELMVEDNWGWHVGMDVATIDRRYDRNFNSRCPDSEPSCVAYRKRDWYPVAQDGNALVVLEWEVWLNRHTDFVGGSFIWNDARGAWVDGGGTPLDLDDVGYLAFPRLNVYLKGDLP